MWDIVASLLAFQDEFNIKWWQNLNFLKKIHKKLIK
jgi:hypothetical protein